MASTAIVKTKGSDTSSAITKRAKLFLDNLAKERFESDFKSRGICASREVNFEFFAKELELSVFKLFTQIGWKPFLAIKEKIYPSLIREFYSNLVFSEEEGEPVGRSMLRGKRVDLTTDNIRSWVGVKKGVFKRYSSREPITMETYSIEKVANNLGGSPNGEVTLAQLGVNERLLAHVLFEEKEESVDSDATLYSESPGHQQIKEEPTEKDSDTSMFSSASDKAPIQDEHQAVSIQLAPEDESAPKNEPEYKHDPPATKKSPKAKPTSSEPLPQPPLAPLDEIHEHLKILIN
ncbi:hypothetical protein G2W53_004127 [Senna tora]|uniref:Uncharacterized protein n=1 Tax=Senna tora TaxID=362788 RepID=A0A835CH08_9FABA|nr:hypothetical protein G2W53_004127 [Senna tora]